MWSEIEDSEAYEDDISEEGPSFIRIGPVLVKFVEVGDNYDPGLTVHADKIIMQDGIDMSVIQKQVYVHGTIVVWDDAGRLIPAEMPSQDP